MFGDIRVLVDVVCANDSTQHLPEKIADCELVRQRYPFRNRVIEVLELRDEDSRIATSHQTCDRLEPIDVRT